MSDIISAKGKYIKVEMPREEFLGLLKELKERTGGQDLLEAFEIMQDFEDLEKFRLLRDLYIAELSGAFKEPLNIIDLYNKV